MAPPSADPSEPGDDARAAGSSGSAADDLLTQALARAFERRGGGHAAASRVRGVVERLGSGRSRSVALVAGTLAMVVLVVAVAGAVLLAGRVSSDGAGGGRAIDDLLPRAGTTPPFAAGPVPGAVATAPGTGPTTPPAQLLVHAAGAVRAPGVYRLAAGSRVDDLVRAAGGVADDGDVDRVNLAAPLDDGSRVYVPHRGELAPPAVVGPSTGAATGAGGSAPTAPAAPAVVDLNTATIEQLDTLPGIGPATAQAIVAWRTEHGRFATVEDLQQVRGIGPARLEQLRPLVRAG